MSSKITVKDADISIIKVAGHDYISLTDMAKGKEDEARAIDVIKNWLRGRNTIEFLGLWEQMNNPSFKVVEFDHFRSQAGLNSFTLNPQTWIEKTNATGIVSKSGRYGGTYAHKDIAFEFGTWISPEFKLILIREFQRLKEDENKRLDSEWDYRRFLAKTNYTLHTDAVKEFRLPPMNVSKEKEWLVYADEADLLNIALFGCTAKAWKEANPMAALDGKNIRDLADLHELIVLSNLEALNSTLIKGNMDRERRLSVLKDSAQMQLASLRKSPYTLDKIQSPFLPKYAPKQLSEGETEIGASALLPDGENDFISKLKAVSKVPPPKKNKKKL